MKNCIVNIQTKAVSLIADGRPWTVTPDNFNYIKIINAIKNDDEAELVKLLNMSFFDGIARLTENGKITLNGKEISNLVAKRVHDFIKLGLPHEPLLRFIENCEQNPNKESVDQLYDFLENKNTPITEDGCFYAYKSVRSDYYDIYSGTILNKPGTVIKFNRENVDNNRHAECSFGLHVGAWDYVNNYGNPDNRRILLVKVNPRDAVSVPLDHGAQKLRVCQYEIVEEIKASLTQTDVMDSEKEDGWKVDLEEEFASCCDPNWDQVKEKTNLELEEKLNLEHTRDSAVQACFDNKLILTKEEGRRLGKRWCVKLLVGLLGKSDLNHKNLHKV
jgi:hypothetical protein